MNRYQRITTISRRGVSVKLAVLAIMAGVVAFLFISQNWRSENQSEPYAGPSGPLSPDAGVEHRFGMGDVGTVRLAPITFDKPIRAEEERAEEERADQESASQELLASSDSAEDELESGSPELALEAPSELKQLNAETKPSSEFPFQQLPSVGDGLSVVSPASFHANAAKGLDVHIALLPSWQDDDSRAWGSLTDAEAREIEAQRLKGLTEFLDIDEVVGDEPFGLLDSQEVVGQLKVGGEKAALKLHGGNADFVARESDKTDISILQSPAKMAGSSRPNGPEDPTWWVTEIHQPLLQGRSKLYTTLDEVIFIAMKNSPQVKILNAQPRIQELIRNEAATEFDWSTFVETRWNDQNDPVGSTITQGNITAGRFEQRDWTYEAGLTKRFLNGGDLRVGQNFGTVENNSNFLNPPEQGNARLVLDYRQPLLRSAGRGFNTSQVLLADLQFQAISNESRAALQSYLVQVVDAFWDIYLRRALLVQSRRSIARAEMLFKQLKSRDGIDVTNEQLLRAEAAVGSRRSEVIRAEYDLINSQDRLINLTVGPNSQNAEIVELMPEPLMLPMGINFEQSQLVQVAIHNRPEIQQALTQIKVGSVQNRIALNQLQPRLDAVISSYVSGLRGNKDIGRAFSDQFSTGEPSYAVGFEFEIPIGNRAAKTRVERSQLEAAIFQQEFQQQVGDVVLDVRVAGREIQRLNQENENNLYALKKASEELELIRKRQQLSLDDNKTGSLYIEDLLSSQARLTVAENRLVASQTEQAVALVDLKRATGELLRSGGESFHASQFNVTGIEPPELSGDLVGFGFPDDAAAALGPNVDGQAFGYPGEVYGSEGMSQFENQAGLVSSNVVHEPVMTTELVESPREPDRFGYAEPQPLPVSGVVVLPPPVEMNTISPATSEPPAPEITNLPSLEEFVPQE